MPSITKRWPETRRRLGDANDEVTLSPDEGLPAIAVLPGPVRVFFWLNALKRAIALVVVYIK